MNDDRSEHAPSSTPDSSKPIVPVPAGGAIPRGLEVVIQKAAVDPNFKAELLAKRVAAVEAVGLPLQPEEQAMLTAIPAEQLTAIIDRTNVPDKMRRLLIGAITAGTLLAIGSIALPMCAPTRGIRPDLPEGGTKGIRPDDPTESEYEPATRGIRPDRPARKTDAPETPPADAPPED